MAEHQTADVLGTDRAGLEREVCLEVWLEADAAGGDMVHPLIPTQHELVPVHPVGDGGGGGPRHVGDGLRDRIRRPVVEQPLEP